MYGINSSYHQPPHTIRPTYFSETIKLIDWAGKSRRLCHEESTNTTATKQQKTAYEIGPTQWCKEFISASPNFAQPTHPILIKSKVPFPFSHSHQFFRLLKICGLMSVDLLPERKSRKIMNNIFI